jgi:hypothetical protein
MKKDMNRRQKQFCTSVGLWNAWNEENGVSDFGAWSRDLDLQEDQFRTERLSSMMIVRSRR